jgi:hypothetical protein
VAAVTFLEGKMMDVIVGPKIYEDEMITDIYLPLL